MTKKIDEMRVANAFAQAAVEGRYESCRGVIANFAHVYREDYKTVLSRVSVSLMDPMGFSPVEYLRIKISIHALHAECDRNI